MSPSLVLRTALTAAALLLATGARSQAPELPVDPVPGLQVNAFGTLGLSRLNRGGVRVQADATATSGIGEQWTARFDSRLGVQASLALLPELGLTWQPVLRQQRDDRFGLNTDWAYLDWRITPQWELKLGRYASPLYLVSDEALVGLGLPWVRPPPEVYGMLGNVEWLDGLWLRRKLALGDDTLRVDLYHASHRDQRPTLNISHAPLTGMGLSLRNTHWTWHAALARSHSTLRIAAIDPLIDLIGNPAAGGNAQAAADYNLRRLDPLRFAALGLRYESGRWLAMAEWTHASSQRKALPGFQAGYLTVGHVAGPWLTHLTWSKSQGRSGGTENRFSGPAAAAAQLLLDSAVLSGQSRLSLGTRWDLRPGLALKAQVDHIVPRSQGRGGRFLAENPQADLPNGHRNAQLYSLVLDWAH